MSDVRTHSELNFQRVFESVPGLYLLLDTGLIIVGVSEPYLRATMTSREQLLGKHIFQAFPDNPEDESASGVSNLRASLLRVLETGKRDTMDIQKYDIRQPDSEGGGFVERHWSPVNSPVFSAAGTLTHIIHAVEDVTNVVRLQQQGLQRTDSLRREQQARAGAESANHRKDQLLAVLSHELRTPLTPILAWVQTLKTEPNLSETVREGLDVIARNAELEARLVADLLDTTRVSNAQLQLKRTRVSIHQMLNDALEVSQQDAAAKPLKITLELAAASHDVDGDPVRLQQIFWNLIGNAIKYTNAGGQITIRTDNPTAHSIRIQVIDSGIGIEPAVISRLFRPFEQGERTLSRKFGGLGLGLSIAKALVELHQGALTVASEGKDRGSTFTVELCLIRQPIAIASVPVPPPTVDAKLKLLVVEDNADTLRILSRLLEHSGHIVTTATTVKDAVAASAAGDFDLIISDIGLPDGTGWELIEKVRMTKNTPAVAVSGFIQPEDIERSREAGFLEHLGKPLDVPRLKTVIQRATLPRTEKAPAAVR